jgi:hypothetical protein
VYGKTVGHNDFMKNKIIMADLAKRFTNQYAGGKKDDYE